MALGGLARRAALVKNARAQGHAVLVVDSGDLFFGPPATATDHKKALAKAQLISRAYAHMGVVAVTVGGGDLVHGLAFLQQEGGRGLPLLSANLVDPLQKKPIFPPYIIQEVSGLRIAFFGLTNPNLPPPPQGKRLEMATQDLVESAQKVVGELKGWVDLIILLSDLGWDQDVRIAKACPGIHFILGGHDGGATRWPQQEGETFIVQSYQKGMYVGRLDLTFEKPSSPFQDEGKPDRLQDEINELDRRVSELKGTKERNPHLDIGRAMEGLDQQRHKLQGELEEARKTSSGCNRFRWTLEPISTSLPEDGEVLQWIKESGITND
jgi:2',3'-cyclic-nucleotide 2'-phosphodiesterase (5'-nucleotidase family)